MSVNFGKSVGELHYVTNEWIILTFPQMNFIPSLFALESDNIQLIFYLSIKVWAWGIIKQRNIFVFLSSFITVSQKVWSGRSNSLTAGRLDFAYAQPRLSTRTCWIFVPHWKLLQRWFWWEVVRTLQMRERSSLYFFGLLQCPSTGSCNSTKDAKYRYCFFMALCQHLAPEIH